MKKLIVIGIAVLLVLGISALSYADERSEDKTIAVQLQVATVFGFQIWDSQLEQILEPYGEPYPDPQDITKIIDPRLGSLTMIVDTNEGVAWYLQASSVGCYSSAYPGSPVALQISTFAGPANPLAGTPVTNLVLTVNPAHIYDSGTGEESVAGFEVPGIFKAEDGAEIQQGTYDGSILLTMVRGM